MRATLIGCTVYRDLLVHEGKIFGRFSSLLFMLGRQTRLEGPEIKKLAWQEYKIDSLTILCL